MKSCAAVWRYAIVGLVAFMYVPFSPPAHATFVEQEDCDDTMWSGLHKHLRIEKMSKEPAEFKNIAPWYGSDGKQYMKILEPDTSKASATPWELKIYVPRTGKPAMLVTITDVGNTSGAYWTGPNTFDVFVFWGRIAETVFTIRTDDYLGSDAKPWATKDLYYNTEPSSCPPQKKNTK